jgi:predicted transcriptional regulator
VTVDSIAQALGEDRMVVYRIAYSLVSRGKPQRDKLPGGQTGFKVVRSG